MKKVSFGFSNDKNPDGSHAGIGASPNLDIVGAEYITVINNNGENYLITKVIDVFKGQESKVGQYDVRRMTYDLYPDGSSVVFVDQNKNNNCLNFEQVLSTDKAKELIDKGVSVSDICDAKEGLLGLRDILFRKDSNVDVPVCGILHEEFEKKKYYLENCHSSFINMQRNLTEAYDKIEQLQKEKEISGLRR